MPLSAMPTQHKMSSRPGLPAHGTRGSSHAGGCCPPSADACSGSATASSSTKTRYNESRVIPSRDRTCAMMALVTDDPFAAAAASAERLTALAGPHDAAVVLGSGWAPAADAIGTAKAEIPLAELGGFPASTVPGHTPTVRSVTAGTVRVLVFLGRVHLYEGLSPAAVVHGVRTAVAAGCRTVVLTNAAGGIRAGLSVGEPVLISDHLNLTGRSPLAGPPPPGSRFADLTDLYSPRLRALAREARSEEQRLNS